MFIRGSISLGPETLTILNHHRYFDLDDPGVSGTVARGLGELFGTQADVARQVWERAVLADFSHSVLDAWQGILHASAGAITIRSSGTTGAPQVVSHSAASLLRGIQGGTKHRQDVWGLTYAPETFAFWQVALQAIYNFNPLVDLYRLSPTETLRKISEQHVTHLSGTPSFFRMLADAGPPSTSVQAVTVGGELCDLRALTAIALQFPAAKIRNVYASTQAGVLLTSDSDVFTIPTHRHRELKVADGELWVTQSLLGDGVTPEALGSERFYATGDLVEVVSGEPGDETMPLRFRFVGRRSAVIQVGGFKVSPERVEAAILALISGVKAVRVYGQANSVTGEIVACDLVMATDGAELEIAGFRRALAKDLPPAAIPRIVQVVNAIEMTHSGKVKRGARMNTGTTE